MEAALHDILINTYNPNHDLRVNAEKALQQFLVTPGSLRALINFIGAVNVHRELRQASGIVLKNRLRDYFYHDEKNPQKALPVTVEEKDYVKEQIMNILLAEQDNSIRGILAESVRVISEFEYPERWPSLVPTILNNIQNADVLRIYNALLALRKLAKRYEYKAKEDRQPFNDLLQVVLPCLQQLLQQIIHHNSIEAAQVMRLCFKVFHSATVYMLPKVSGIDVNLWFTMIADILNKPLPEASAGVEPLGQPTDPAERKTWPWWKLKKWTSRIMTHFLQRYGNPRYCNEDDKTFAEYFRNNTAILLLGPAMNNLMWKAQGVYITDDVHRSCLTYLHNCAEMSPTYKLMKPNLEFILYQAIFPTLCMSHEEVQLFEEDPQEFIRKIHNPISDWLSPMVAAINLLQSLARYRQKDVLPLFLPFLQNMLETYNAAPPSSKDYIRKDGVLVAIASLAKIMLDSKQYRSTLVPFLQIHILPEFKSPVAFLRARACWMIEYFSEMDWEQEATTNEAPNTAVQKLKNKKKKDKATAASPPAMTAGEILRAVLQCLIESLKDPSLPVQAAAACSLQSLIEQEGATELLRPLLPQIISEYFRIMEEVENESVLIALQGIVQQYGEELAGMAPTMVQHLVKKFHDYSQETEDEEAAFNAAQCLDTIDSILEQLEEQEAVLQQIEPILQPLILQILSNCDDCFEYIDTAVHMISCYTYYYDAGISPTMWSICGPLIHALNEWAIDYIAEIMVPILNYMTKGMEVFLNLEYQGEKVLTTMLKALAKVYENSEGYSGKDYNSASNLLGCLIISCKHLNNHPAAAAPVLLNYLPSIITLALEKLTVVKLKSVKIRLLEIIMAAFYYDAQVTLSIFTQIQSPAIIQALSLETQKPPEEYQKDPTSVALIFYFHRFFGLIADMDRDFTERLIVLSFLAILSLPQASLPPIIQMNLPSMFQQVVREVTIIEEEAKKEREREAAGEDDEEEEEEDDDYDEEDEDDEEEMGRGERRGKGKSGGRKDYSLRQVDDEDDEEFDDSDPVAAENRRLKALYVPEGGYHEDEDCLNAEDEEYRQVLENLSKEDQLKREAFMAGEPVDDEEDEDFIYTSPVENLSMAQLLMQVLQGLNQRDPQFLSHYLQQNLTEEDHQRLQALMQLAHEQQQALTSPSPTK